MTPSIIQLVLSLWIPLILSTISSLIPSEISEELKIKLFTNSLDTSIIFLRSQGFEATYDEINTNIYNDYIEIKNFNIKKQFKSKDLPFCDASKIKMDSIWKDPACELLINIENVQFKGFNFNKKIDNFFEINIDNISFDTSMFNDSSSKATKKLFKIEETINLNFSTRNKYNFNKNIFENKIFLEVEKFGNLSLEVKLSNLIYNEEQLSAVLDSFILEFVDQGVLERINTFIDIELDTNLIEIVNKEFKTKSLLNIDDENEIEKIEEHNQLISNVNRHYSNFDQNIVKLLAFIENPSSLKCIRYKDHIINNNISEAIDDLGPILLFAVFCENIIIDDPT
jgi:hypothetical protein